MAARKAKPDDKRRGRAVAIVTIRRPEEMTAAGAKDVADWLRRVASGLLKHRAKLGPGYRARYLASD